MFRITFTLAALFLTNCTAFADDDWTWSEDQTSIVHYFLKKPVGYEVRLIRLADWEAGGNAIHVEVHEEGKKVYQWRTHIEGAFVFSNSTLVYSTHHPNASGCHLIAVDLNTGKQLWASSLDGIGPVNHSQYQNQINLRIHQGQITVLGNESFGQYIEMVDLKTGQTKSNKAGTGQNQRF